METELDKLEFPNSIPKGVCHCDFDISNLKFEGNKLIGVLDFDDACYTYLIYDVATLMYYWAWLREDEFDYLHSNHCSSNWYSTPREILMDLRLIRVENFLICDFPCDRLIVQWH